MRNRIDPAPEIAGTQPKLLLHILLCFEVLVYCYAELQERFMLALLPIWAVMAPQVPSSRIWPLIDKCKEGYALIKVDFWHSACVRYIKNSRPLIVEAIVYNDMHDVI